MSIPPEQIDTPLLVTAAVIIQEEMVLITRRPDHKPHGGFWEFPGGKLNPGESPAAALKREMREELEIEVSVEHIIDALYYRYDWGPVLILAYRCSISRGTPRNIEVAEHRWVPLNELQQFKLLPADKPLIEQLQKLIKSKHPSACNHRFI
jgi:8-oxo-dGTP diphosphatase